MSPLDTCWTLVHGAAGGDATARERFAVVYLPVVRGYLAARWSGRGPVGETEDAVQEVFVECLREGGALEGALHKAGKGFRAFLYGVAVNVARRFEARKRGVALGSSVDEALAEVEASDDPASRIFDRGWAIALVREAAERLRVTARGSGEEARRRVELLDLRFAEDLPIREIARRWDADPADVHHAYARARKEFKDSLRAVIAYHHPDSPGVVERELERVLGDLT